MLLYTRAQRFRASIEQSPALEHVISKMKLLAVFVLIGVGQTRVEACGTQIPGGMTLCGSTICTPPQQCDQDTKTCSRAILPALTLCGTNPCALDEECNFATNQCIKKDPCSAKVCARNERCVEQKTMCISAPCPSNAICVPMIQSCRGACRPNEECDDQNNQCVNVHPCMTMRCSSGTSCVETPTDCNRPICPVRGQCLATNPTKPPPSCDDINCFPGETCEMLYPPCPRPPVPVPNNYCPPVPVCRRHDNVQTCETLQCPSGQGCVLEQTLCRGKRQIGPNNCPPRAVCRRNEEPCGDAKCLPGQMCNRVTNLCVDMNPCRTTRCDGGKRCVEKPVMCVSAPCSPMAECVPSTCESMTCNNGYTCEMRPPPGCNILPSTFPRPPVGVAPRMGLISCESIPVCRPHDLCRNFVCQIGQMCVVQPGECKGRKKRQTMPVDCPPRPVCQPRPSPTCAAMLCQVGHICEEGPPARCVPSQCGGCQQGTSCVALERDCVPSLPISGISHRSKRESPPIFPGILPFPCIGQVRACVADEKTCAVIDCKPGFRCVQRANDAECVLSQL